jgi:hypothetical protein
MHVGIGGLFPVVSACQSVYEDANEKSLMDNMNAILEELSVIITANMVIGQDAVENIEDSYRITSTVQQMTDNVTISAPVSDLEDILQIPRSSVSIPAIENGSTTDQMAVNFIETSSRLFTNGSSFNSNTAKIIVTMVSNGDSSPSYQLISFVLQNHEPQTYGNSTVNRTAYSTTCRKKETSSTVHLCPSGELLHHNCTGSGGTITSVCPMVVNRPKCQVLVGDTLLTGDMCRVLSYTSTNTTCECRLDYTSLRRRLASGGGAYESSGAVELVAMSEYSGDGVVDTLTYADDVTVSDLEDSYQVIVLYATLW